MAGPDRLDRTALTESEGGRPAYPLMAMPRVHLLQNWFSYSDPAMKEALYEKTVLREFSGLRLEHIPDETTILNFRRLLERYELVAGILAVINGYLGDRGLSLRTIIDATLIHAPSSTKNKDGKRSISPAFLGVNVKKRSCDCPGDCSCIVAIPFLHQLH